MKALNTEYVVFDVETTGLNPLTGDRMVEIGAIKVKNGEIVDKFESFINPERELSIEAQRVNNITQEMVEDAPTASEILPKMVDFVGGACLVGHNVGFDLKFLCYQLSLIGRKLREGTPSVDTLKMARRLLPQLTNHKLGNVASYLGVRVGETHRALADVELTVAVMLRLLSIAKDVKIESFRDVSNEFGVNVPEFKIKQVTQEFLF